MKDTISLIKYSPQVYLNWQRSSTAGFAMGMVFCDLAGGMLSILQQLVSCSFDPSTGFPRTSWSWEPLLGNKPKIILGLIAITYDCIFLYQHFFLYGASGAQRDLSSGSAAPAT